MRRPSGVLAGLSARPGPCGPTVSARNTGLTNVHGLRGSYARCLRGSDGVAWARRKTVARKQASRQADKQASRQHRKTHNRVWGNLARCEDRNSFTGLCLWRTRSPSCAAQLKASCAAQLNPRIALIKLWLLRADYQPVHLSSAISGQRAGFSEQLHRHRPRCAVVRLT